MKRFGKWAALAAAYVSLGGCSQIVIVSDPVTHPNYVKDEELYAARNGAIRVEVDGDTFGLPREQFADLVVDRMRASYYRHDMFTREASRATDPRYKIVMMFNADPAVSGNNLCAAAQPFAPVPRPKGERSVLLAAFCGGTLALSENSGWVALSGVDDPNFVRLVDQVTATLFPKTDIRYTSGGDPTP
jgi:hypothetical protein